MHPGGHAEHLIQLFERLPFGLRQEDQDQENPNDVLLLAA